MRLVQVAPDLRQVGGITNHVRRLCGTLAADGHEVATVSSPSGPLFKSIAGIPGFALGVREASRDADLIHFHASRWAKPALGGLAPWFSHAPRSVLSLHSGALVRGAWYSAYLGALVERFDAVIVMSTSVRDALRQVVPDEAMDRIAVCSPFLPRSPRLAPRFTPAAPVLASGRWAEMYRHDDAIDAVAVARDSGLPLRLVLAVSTAGSSAAYRSSVLARARSLDWVEVREDAELVEMLTHERWSCLLRTTASDSFGLATHEAVWSGVPVVATRVGVRPSRAWLFEVGDVARAALGLVRISARPGEVAAEVRSAQLRSGYDEIMEVYESATSEATDA